MPRRAGLSERTTEAAPLLGTLASGDGGKLRPLGQGAVRVWTREDLGEGSSRDRLARLVDENRLEAAATLLAFALPEREAVWWGCMCVGSVLPSRAGDERQTVEVAESWVRMPGRDTRVASLAAGKGVGSRTPSAAIAFAAFSARLDRPFASGTGRWIQEALKRLLATAAAVERDAMLRGFIGSACDIAAGGAGRLAAMSVASR